MKTVRRGGRCTAIGGITATGDVLGPQTLVCGIHGLLSIDIYLCFSSLSLSEKSTKAGHKGRELTFLIGSMTHIVFPCSISTP